MAITYPVAMPDLTSIASCNFSIAFKTTQFKSPFTGHQQVLERPGALWLARYEIKPIAQGVVAGQWTAFFASLRGVRGYFDAFDPLRQVPLGTGNGTPLVNGAAQTGNALITDGWNPLETVLLRGDYFELEDRFYTIVEDVTSDSSGDATLTIEPQLRSAPADDAALTITNPKCQMRLAVDNVGWSETEGAIYGFAFDAIERLPVT